MKNKIISIILLSASLSITGCGTQQASVEPTETVIETETEEVAVETETSEIIYSGFSLENIVFDSNNQPIDYNEAFLNECKKYNLFVDCTDDEIKHILLTDVEVAIGTSQRTPELYSAIISSMNDSGTTGKELLALEDESNSSTSSKTTTNTATSDTDKSSTKNNTEPNTPSTSSQPTEVASNDAPADNVTSEVPVQSVDDGFEDESNLDLSQYEDIDWSESSFDPHMYETNGHAAEDFGYHIGSTVSDAYSDTVLTYQGNDTWIDNYGNTWISYVTKLGYLRFESGIH